MEDFKPGDYHPAFHHPPVHDHHRRARRALVWGIACAVIGAVFVYWSSETVWGTGQRDIARILGWGLGATGTGLLVFAAIAYFVIDDDLHPDEPDE